MICLFSLNNDFASFTEKFWLELFCNEEVLLNSKHLVNDLQ